jgi:hypothetical protein
MINFCNVPYDIRSSLIAVINALIDSILKHVLNIRSRNVIVHVRMWDISDCETNSVDLHAHGFVFTKDEP